MFISGEAQARLQLLSIGVTSPGHGCLNTFPELVTVRVRWYSKLGWEKGRINDKSVTMQTVYLQNSSVVP